MALLEGQAQIRDLIMGPGTPYTLRDFNPFTRTVRANQKGERPWSDGTWSGAEFLDETVVPITIHIKGSGRSAGDWLTSYFPLMSAFEPVADGVEDIELRFVIGGTEYLMFGRPQMIDPDVQSIGTGKSFAEAAFVANNPRIYSAATFTAKANLPFTVGGVATPIRAPFRVIGVRVGGELLMVNGGVSKTPVKFRIDGPVSVPKVTFTDPSGTVTSLQVGFDLATGQFLDIDTSNHLVLLNGTTTRRGDVSGDFPLLMPGTSSARFNSSTFNEAALLTATWRYAW